MPSILCAETFSFCDNCINYSTILLLKKQYLVSKSKVIPDFSHLGISPWAVIGGAQSGPGYTNYGPFIIYTIYLENHINICFPYNFHSVKMTVLFHLIVAFLLHKNGLQDYMILSRLCIKVIILSCQSQNSSLFTVKGPIPVTAV